MKHSVIAIILAFAGTQLYSIEDLTKKSWSEAFEIVHAKVKVYYPFTDHKKINLDSLYTVTASAINKAEEEKNDTAYFIAIRKYAHALKDNHVFAKRKGFNLCAERLAGHVGFEILPLDNGDMVISQIREGTGGLPQEVQIGTKIIKWDSVPIQQAVGNTSFLSEENMEATIQNKFLKQCELLMYQPIGNEINIAIQSGDGETKTIKIISQSVAGLKPARVYPKQTIWRKTMESPVDFNVFDDDSIGYFQISIFMPNLNDFTIPSTFQEKLWLLERLHIQALIIDLRGNVGGIDTWAEKIAGHFVSEPKHYQYVSKFNEASGLFEIDSTKTSVVTPRKPYFNKPVLILVDNCTVSTGEGIPMVLKDLPNVHIAGQFGTGGAFAVGFSEFIFKMPENIAFGFFEGRSLDENGNIQIDADYRGIGGITPDIRVPVSLESINAQYVENNDYVLDYAIDYLRKNK